MILLTIGTQLPFDRLVRALDELAKTVDEEIFGQIGKDAEYLPQHFEYCRSMAPKDFDEKFRSARVIVSHAGIGTILSARKHAKPIVVVPRQVKFGEHRNDHQLATCAQLSGKRGIYVASEMEALQTILRQTNLAIPESVDESPDRAKLLQGLRAFANQLPVRQRRRGVA